MKRITDTSYKIFTGASEKKSLLRIPMVKMGTCPTAFGVTQVYVDCFGTCRGCNEQVWFGREKPGKQWVPLVEKSDEQGIYELHRCEAELLRNASLRRLVYGEDNQISEK